jgi:amphi-Trp domain-containing protein
MGRSQTQQDFEHESVQDTVSVVAYLEAIIGGLREGKLVLRSDERLLYMFPHGLMNLEVKAKRSGPRNKISLKMTWKDTRPTPDAPLEIGK